MGMNGLSYIDRDIVRESARLWGREADFVRVVE